LLHSGLCFFLQQLSLKVSLSGAKCYSKPYRSSLDPCYPLQKLDDCKATRIQASSCGGTQFTHPCLGIRFVCYPGNEVSYSVRNSRFETQFIPLSLSLLSVKAPNSPIPDLVIACGEIVHNMPRPTLEHTVAATVVILIFATQPVGRSCCFYLSLSLRVLGYYPRRLFLA
jgi:hypothetical protein